MSISKADVKYIAGLARIYVPESEQEALAANLSSIVTYVEQLSKIDVQGVLPTSHAVAIGNVLREDSVRPSLTNQEALSIAPAKDKGSFKVPLVIE